MTCGYMRDVATANTWTFIKLLFRWNGSVWKSIHMELIVWLFIFVNIRTAYEFFFLGTEAANTYEHVVHRCRQISGKCRTVMTFAIGFFVTYVSGRWWNIFMTIPWPDSCALQLTAFLRVRGKRFEQEDRLFRQNIMRYLWLAYVLVFRDVSVRIKKRFPSVKSMTPTLLTEEELKKLNRSSKEMRPWVPIEWILDYLRTAKRRNLLDEFHYIELNQTILSYRQQLHEILCHDSITVPLVYVQSVHICTICYFIITCFASQTIHSDHDSWETVIDFYLPVYAMIEFIVFVGWLKTAFVMLNPFGMDDDDFEMNALIERNMMVSLSYINDFYDKPPKLVDIRVCLPTNLQEVVRENANPMHGSAVPVKMTRVQQAMQDDPQLANLISTVLPTRRPSTTALHTHRPINEFPNIDKTAAMMANNATTDEEEKEEKKLRNPDNSSRDDGGSKEKYLLKQEDIEAAVNKLLDKKLAEEKEVKEEKEEKKEEKEKSLSPEPTQKSWISEEATQKTVYEDAPAPSVLQKKMSRIKTRASKADVRPSMASARKPVKTSIMTTPTVSTSSQPSKEKKKEGSRRSKTEDSVSLKEDKTQSGEK
uniref:Bestrophin homolog n=2 Tax=Caenorhabditis tropicalis TaxID=1561998 RepID=A0A1I7UEA2_9PELO